jgi:hypothetical protein
MKKFLFNGHTQFVVQLIIIIFLAGGFFVRVGALEKKVDTLTEAVSGKEGLSERVSKIEGFLMPREP